MSVFAANPADLTNSHRPCPVHFSKYANDVKSWYLLDIAPIGKSDSMLVCRWQTNDEGLVQYQLIYAKMVNPLLDVAFNAELWKGSPNREDLVVDIHTKTNTIGLALWVPFQSENDLLVGPRVSHKGFTAYATVGNGSSPLYGISYCQRGNRVDLAWAPSNTCWIRASKPFGKVIPELRVKLTKDESFFGFAIAYCP